MIFVVGFRDHLGVLEMGQVTASHRYARISPTKVNRILPLIRGMDVNSSLDALRVVHNRAARMIEGVIQSAASNAVDGGVRNVGRLPITSVVANSGPMVKRIRAKSRGMAYVERHRTSHIVVVVNVPEPA